MEKITDSMDNERLKLSLELHDGPVQLFVAAEYIAEACRNLLKRNDLEKLDKRLLDVQQMLADGVHDLRVIVHDLHSTAIEQSGLVPAINSQLNYLSKSGIDCHLEVKGAITPLDSEAEKNVFYIVREALNNIYKHACASKLDVRIEFKESEVETEIRDNGVGFDPEKKYESIEHLGLTGMKERAILLAGNLVIKSKPGCGTKLILTFPISTESEPAMALVGN